MHAVSLRSGLNLPEEIQVEFGVRNFVHEFQLHSEIILVELDGLLSILHANHSMILSSVSGNIIVDARPYTPFYRSLSRSL